MSTFGALIGSTGGTVSVSKTNSTTKANSTTTTNSTKSSVTSHSKNCTMHCVNKGVCRRGQQPYGFNTIIQEEDPNPISKQTRVFDMFCDCPTGYTGFNCEIKFIVCDKKGQTKCANGAKCQPYHDDDGNMFSHCGCDAIHSNLTASYAAQFCQQQSRTIFCGPTNTFCTNGGICLEPSQIPSRVNSKSSTGLMGPQCKCPAGFEGPHCEFPVGTIVASKSSSDSFDPNPAGISGLVVAGLTMVMLLLGAAYGIYRLYCRRTSPSTKNASSDMTLEADGSSTMTAKKNYNAPTPPAFLTPTSKTNNNNNNNIKDIHALDDDEQSTCSRQSTKSSRGISNIV